MSRAIWALECLDANGRIMFATGETREDVYFTARGAGLAAARLRHEDRVAGIITEVRVTRYEPTRYEPVRRDT